MTKKIIEEREEGESKEKGEARRKKKQGERKIFILVAYSHFFCDIKTNFSLQHIQRQLYFFFCQPLVLFK